MGVQLGAEGNVAPVAAVGPASRAKRVQVAVYASFKACASLADAAWESESPIHGSGFVQRERLDRQHMIHSNAFGFEVTA